MSRRRYVSTEISTDKAVNRLATGHSDFAALLYTWLIPHAEDDATFDADPEELLMKVVPGRRDKEPEDIQRALDAMLAMRLIERCADARRLRFPPESFYKYQSYIKGDRRGSTPAAPDAAPPTPAAQNSADQRNSPQIIASSSFSSSLSDSDSDSPEDAQDAAAPAPPAKAQPQQKPVRPTPKPRVDSGKAARIAKVADAFRAIGLKFPALLPQDAKAVGALLDAGYSPSTLAECWRDFKNDQYRPDDDFADGQLSFQFLCGYNRVGNWQDWVEAGRPQQTRGGNHATTTGANRLGRDTSQPDGQVSEPVKYGLESRVTY